MEQNKQELNNELDEDNDFNKDNSIDEFDPSSVFKEDEDPFLPNINNDEFIPPEK